MPRTNDKPPPPVEKPPHNPFGAALGFCIRELRRESGRNTSDMHDLIGVSSSNYRLLEAGSGSLAFGRAWNLIRVFDSIEFTRLIAFLGTAEAIWASAATMEEVRRRLRDAMSLVPALRPFLDRMERVLDSAGSVVHIREAVFRFGLHTELRDYLCARESNTDHLLDVHRRAPSDLSPLLQDALRKALEPLRGFRLRFTASELWRFEQNHRQDIEKVFGLLRAPDLFLSTIHVNETPGYQYLWTPRFYEMRILVLDAMGKLSGTQIKEEFGRALERNIDPLVAKTTDVATALEKVRVLVVPPALACRCEEVLAYSDVQMNHFWLYHLAGSDDARERVIGFIDAAPEKPDPTTPPPVGDVLTEDEVNIKMSLFEEVLSELSPS